MLTCIDVQFIFHSACLGLSSSANIFRIADVALRVVFVVKTKLADTSLVSRVKTTAGTTGNNG